MAMLATQSASCCASSFRVCSLPPHSKTHQKILDASQGSRPSLCTSSRVRTLSNPTSLKLSPDKLILRSLCVRHGRPVAISRGTAIAARSARVQRYRPRGLGTQRTSCHPYPAEHAHPHRGPSFGPVCARREPARALQCRHMRVSALDQHVPRGSFLLSFC